jgi:hypothetical protein
MRGIELEIELLKWMVVNTAGHPGRRGVDK